MSDEHADESPDAPDGNDEHVIIPLDEHRTPEAAGDIRGDLEDEFGDEGDDAFEIDAGEHGDGRPLAGELSDLELRGIIEALLFSAAEPVSVRKLAQLAGARDGRTVRRLIAELQGEYDAHGRTFTIVHIARGYQMMTREELHPWVNKLRHREQEESLSQAALETLAIAAYRQPVTRAQIEDIRGVGSGYILRSLIEKSLVRVAGRSDELGRPLLYGTTDVFLDVFGLPSLKALPKLEELEPPANA